MLRRTDGLPGLVQHSRRHYGLPPAATANLLEITLLWLPTYASWTNPIEKRWSKQTLVHHPCLVDQPDTLHQQMATFLDRFHTGPEDLLHDVGLLPNKPAKRHYCGHSAAQAARQGAMNCARTK